MTHKAYFFSGLPDSSDPSGYDRSYNQEDHAAFYRSFFVDGVFINDDEDACLVSSNGTSVVINPGNILAQGYQCKITEAENLAIDLDGSKYRIVVRLDTDLEVRDFYPLVLKGTASAYPDLVRDGDIYDICLAEIATDGTTSTVVDTRADRDLCGFAAFTGQPPYQPPGDIPALVWEYTMFPEQLTDEQRQMVESTPAWIEMYSESRIANIKMGWTLLAAYETAGTITYTHDIANGTDIGVLVMGGGAGGAWNYPSGGGAGGFVASGILSVSDGQQISGVVGSAGVGGSNATPNGTPGGASSFGALTALGGGVGVAGDSSLSGGKGGDGGTGAGGGGAYPGNGGSCGSNGQPGTVGNASRSGGLGSGLIINPFDITMLLSGAGGGNSSNAAENGRGGVGYKGKGGDGTGTAATVTNGDATGNGNGGGAGRTRGGNGTPGLVLIYKRGAA